MNTQINYLYRDADNYKIPNSCIIHGEMTAEQEKQICSNLLDGLYFIPWKVGMPERKFDDLTEADHPWFEWCGIECTGRIPTVAVTAEELINRFRAASQNWENGVPIQTPPKTPYRVVFSEFITHETIVWAEDEGAAAEMAEKLVGDGTIQLNGDEWGCEVNGVADVIDLKGIPSYGLF